MLQVIEKTAHSNDDQSPLARSIGQIIQEHLEEIIGPEMAKLYREHERGRD